MPRVEAYGITVFGSDAREGPSGGSSIGSSGGYNGRRAQIELYRNDEVFGYIWFVAPGEPIPMDSAPGGYIHMNLPLSMFGAVLDILRNEKPLNVEFVCTHAAEVAQLYTRRTEPVGEAE